MCCTIVTVMLDGPCQRYGLKLTWGAKICVIAPGAGTFRDSVHVPLTLGTSHEFG